MKLNLVSKYNYKNIEGQAIEILDVQRHSNYASGFRCLAKLEGKPEPVWLTIDWFCKEVQRPTPLAPDRAKRAAKSKPSASKRSKIGAAGKA